MVAKRGWVSDYRTFEKDGFEILVGKGARQNDVLTFEVAQPDDFWMHASGYAGSHVVVKNPDRLKTLPRQLLDVAAALAAFHSKARNAKGKIEVHCCKIRQVSKPRNFPAGKVTIRKFDKLKVYPHNPFESEDDA